jgi:hypothetical protein
MLRLLSLLLKFLHARRIGFRILAGLAGKTARPGQHNEEFVRVKRKAPAEGSAPLDMHEASATKSIVARMNSCFPMQQKRKPRREREAFNSGDMAARVRGAAEDLKKETCTERLGSHG